MPFESFSYELCIYELKAEVHSRLFRIYIIIWSLSFTCPWKNLWLMKSKIYFIVRVLLLMTKTTTVKRVVFVQKKNFFFKGQDEALKWLTNGSVDKLLNGCRLNG